MHAASNTPPAGPSHPDDGDLDADEHTSLLGKPSKLVSGVEWSGLTDGVVMLVEVDQACQTALVDLLVMPTHLLLLTHCWRSLTCKMDDSTILTDLYYRH